GETYVNSDAEEKIRRDSGRCDRVRRGDAAQTQLARRTRRGTGTNQFAINPQRSRTQTFRLRAEREAAKNCTRPGEGHQQTTERTRLQTKPIRSRPENRRHILREGWLGGEPPLAEWF